MKVINFRYFAGRNIYCHKPCIRMDVDLEGFRDTPSKDIEGFNENLVSLMPVLKQHRCGIDEEGGFVKRLKEGTYLSHICEHIIIGLQNIIGIEVAYGKAREISGDKYYIIYECKYKDTAIETGDIAVKLINSLILKKTFDINNALKRLKGVLGTEELGPSTLAIINAAKKKGIPTIKIGDGSMFQLGYGKTSKMIEATIGNDTSCLSVDVACDKYLTKKVLSNQCIPVASGELVKNSVQMLLIAQDIGYPVVIKPRYGNQGKGVFVNLKNEKELIEAYKSIVNEYSDIMIEKYVKGRDYRVCMVNNKVIAVAKRIPPYIIGNGKDTILQLINKLNTDKKRGEGHEKPLTKIKINKEVINYISKNAYSLDSVLNKGEKVVLRENANLSTGGTSIDCTDIICDENKQLCERTSKAIGLDICGIDICCNDISKPIDGVILEVNAAPGIRMHEFPNVGDKRDVSGAIVDFMFKDIKKQIPVVSITGTNGKTTTTRLISYILSTIGKKTGTTTTGGIYINNKCIYEGDTTGYDSALTVLTNKDVDVAVLETARGGMIKKGLAYDLADVGVITNITSDHLGIDGVNTLKDLAFIKSLVAEAVKEDGYTILNADDPISNSIVERVKSKIIFFSTNKDNILIQNHIKDGNYGVYVWNDYLYIENKNVAIPLMKIDDIKITLKGNLKYNVENAMAACATLVALGVDYSYIKKGLETFSLDEKHNPGRFNIYKLDRCTVILDYGHNIEGYKAVINGLKNMKYTRLVGIIGAPGDRRNEDIIELGNISGENFDYIYIKEDKDKRNRISGEVAKLLRNGIMNNGFNRKNINIILDEKEALKHSIKNSKEGDLIVIFFEEYKPLFEIIKNEMNILNQNKQCSNKELA